MNELLKRARCKECGARLEKTNLDSPYAVCPNNHRLVVLSHRDLINVKIMEELPEANGDCRSGFSIAGHDGGFKFGYGSGRRPPEPDIHLPPGCVIAYLYSSTMRVRVFYPVGD